MKKIVLASLLLVTSVAAFAQYGLTDNPLKEAESTTLSDLTNYQFDTPNMVSAGQPDEEEFATLKALGVTQVIDLLPGDRSEEAEFVRSIGLTYNNVAVEWNEPTLQNFVDYVALMQSSQHQGSDLQDVTLTHCKLNWRGAVFTYLYRVTQLHHDDSKAWQHMAETWEPNRKWRAYIKTVKAKY